MRWPAAILLGVFASACATTTTSSPDALRAVTRATGAALQGDGTRAQMILRAVRARELGKEDREFRACVLARYQSPVVVPDGITDPFARDVLRAYRSYWNASLLRPTHRVAEEETLVDTLRRLLDQPQASGIGDLEPLLAERLRQAGYYSLQGRTGVLRELMMWKRQNEQTRRVELPEGPHDVRVVLLDDFVSLGWGDYATCGRRGTGGWAKSDALYAVVPRYKSLDSEEFRVSFLGHESQHFADLARFRDLAPWELEYRAKLVELAQARLTRAKVLRKFTEDQRDDPASPHSYANWRLLAALRRRLGLPADADLGQVGVPELEAAAIAELREDTARRLAASR